MQLINRGYSIDRNGKAIKYLVPGNRMSGDMNTAVGNCLLVVLFIITILAGLRYEIMDDGDDFVVILEEETADRAQQLLLDGLRECGMSPKLEGRTKIIHEIVFCQSQMIEVLPGTFRFIRNCRKVMSNALVGKKYFNDNGRIPELVYTIGLCELILNLGVPILQEFALALCRNAQAQGAEETINFQEADPDYWRVKCELRIFHLKKLQDIKPRDIHPIARDSFNEAFGISVTEQLLVEQALRSWSFNLRGRTQEASWSQVLWEPGTRFPSCLYLL